MENKFYQISDNEVKALRDERAIIHYISTNDVDRVKDVMNPQGMDSSDFEKTRTVFFNHDYNRPIAKNVELVREPNGVRAKTIFSSTKFADDVYNWHLEGVINTWSIGFRAKSEDVEVDEKTGIWNYKKWNLLEYSSAPLPANPNALDSAKGIAKSYEGIAMIELGIKAYELNTIIEEQSKELSEIKELIKNLNKTETNENIKQEIQKEIEEQTQNIYSLIDKNSVIAASYATGLMDKFKALESAVSEQKLSDKELAKILTGELMKFTNSQIVRAFLQVTGKEIKL